MDDFEFFSLLPARYRFACGAARDPRVLAQLTLYVLDSFADFA